MGRASLWTKGKDAQCSHHGFAASIKAADLDYLIDRKERGKLVSLLQSRSEQKATLSHADFELGRQRD